MRSFAADMSVTFGFVSYFSKSSTALSTSRSPERPPPVRRYGLSSVR